VPLAGRIHELGCGTGAVCLRSHHDRVLSEQLLGPICQLA
jgi:hypothetical protein